MKHRISVVVLAGMLSTAGPAAAQDMARVRALYVGAAYEEALAAMPAGLSATAGTELEQYRALCLLALGRDNDAKATIERLVKAHPAFVPPAEEVSPRLRTLFTRVRNALMPGLIKQSYADAKAAYDARDREAARAGFQRTLELIDGLPEESRGALTDMRVLAAGFHDLVAVPAAPTEPSGLASPATSAVPPSAATPSGAFMPAVAIRQELPPWNPLDSLSRRTEYVGLLQVQIGPDGRVTLARVLKVSHPSYDVTVLREAKRWLYQPATRSGHPVASEREIEIRLRPQTPSDSKAGGY